MKEAVSKKGICQKCGCCWWMDHDETICSHCFWKLNEEEIRHYGED